MNLKKAPLDDISVSRDLEKKLEYINLDSFILLPLF